MAKLNRIYKLTIQTNLLDQALEISNPITIDFTIERGIYAGVNSMDIDIYNLSPKNRNLLFQDTFDPKAYKKIILEAGYLGKGMSIIFIGNIFNAYSFRRGVNVITHIHAMDGGLDTQTTQTSLTLQAGSNIGDVINGLVSSFPHLKNGTQKIDNHVFSRPVVLDGNTFQLLKKYTNNEVFIDMEEVNIMKDTDAIEGYVPYINDKSGLLATPERRNASLSINMIFEPRILVGQIIEVESKIASQFDGQYKVIGLQHQGMISDSVSGNCTTNIELFVGAQLFGKFNVINAKQQQIVN